MINIEDFQKADLRIGRVLGAERVEGSDKLLKLEIDIGEEKRQILAGIGKHYSPESLQGKELVVIVNLEPRMMMGLESQGMVLAVKDENTLSVLNPEKEVAPGSKIS